MANAIRNLGQIRARQNPLRRGDQEMMDIIAGFFVIAVLIFLMRGVANSK